MWPICAESAVKPPTKQSFGCTNFCGLWSSSLVKLIMFFSMSACAILQWNLTINSKNSNHLFGGFPCSEVTAVIAKCLDFRFCLYAATVCSVTECSRHIMFTDCTVMQFGIVFYAAVCYSVIRSRVSMCKHVEHDIVTPILSARL